jgi:hypothetical protein
MPALYTVSTQYMLSVIMTVIVLKVIESPGVVAHTCNPSYSGGRDQVDRSSRLVQAKSYLNK